MSTVRIEQLVKRFGATTVVDGVSLEVRDGELLALLGRSGSGKTTLLRLIAGFEAAEAGRIVLAGEDVTARDALGRRCGMVFQHYALFPHLTVGENVGYGLAHERLTRDAQAGRVAEALAMVDLAGTEARSVTSLSGGQQQRVALARALAPRPQVLLLDEPLSNLDPTLRERTRGELRDLIRRVGITTILVTHEQEEAFDLADRVAVLHAGRLEQVDTPLALYRHPATPFVAGFVGRATALPGVVARDDAGHPGVLAAGCFWPADAGIPAGDATLMLRPEALRFAEAGGLRATVLHGRFAGATTYYAVRLHPADQVVEVAGPAGVDEGAQVGLEPTGQGVHAFAGSPA